MPPEFRFECKFCNKPIFVTYDLGGKQVRCPHCKNPVPVPVRDNPNADEKEEKEAKTSPKTKSSSTPQAAVKKKNPEKRPIHSKQNFGIGSIVKLVLLAAILFGGYKGYHYYRQQWQKDVPTLLKEYEEGKIIDAVGIKVKVKEEDYGTLVEYSQSPESKVRALVAECIGSLVLPKSMDVLKKLLHDKESEVRSAAAEAFSNIRAKRSIHLLIERLGLEKDDGVRGKIGQSLRELTGERGLTVKRDDWERWWKENQNRFNAFD